MEVEMREIASREQLKSLMAAVISVHGHTVPDDETTDLREIPFRSLDFSELALRVEDEIGRELNFDAPGLRSIRTVSDVLDLLEQLQAG
jgi:acyl carrier protein